jgi:hypothetical protein
MQASIDSRGSLPQNRRNHNETHRHCRHPLDSRAGQNVFDVWIDPKSPGGPWFGAERVILNPVVDGLFILE